MPSSTQASNATAGVCLPSDREQHEYRIRAAQLRAAGATCRRADRGGWPLRHRRRVPPGGCRPRAPATRSSRRAASAAGPGSCSSSPGCGPTRTCSRWASRSGLGLERGRSPTATDILRYLRDTATEYGVDKRISYHRRVTGRAVVDRRRPLDGERSRTPRPVRGASRPAASCTSARVTTAMTRVTRRTGQACPASPAPSCTRSTGRPTWT